MNHLLLQHNHIRFGHRRAAYVNWNARLTSSLRFLVQMWPQNEVGNRLDMRALIDIQLHTVALHSRHSNDFWSQLQYGEGLHQQARSCLGSAAEAGN